MIDEQQQHIRHQLSTQEWEFKNTECMKNFAIILVLYARCFSVTKILKISVILKTLATK